MFHRFLLYYGSLSRNKYEAYSDDDTDESNDDEDDDNTFVF